MPRGKKFSAEQIIGKLREAEVLLAQGETVSTAWPAIENLIHRL